MNIGVKLIGIFVKLEYPNRIDEITIGQIGDVGYKYLSMGFVLDQEFQKCFDYA